VVIWKLALGIGSIAVGAFVLLNRERMLRWSQKHLQQNVGEVGRAFADAGKPNHMIVPGIGTIAIGVILVFQAAG
jgi:hypothetical protein